MKATIIYRMMKRKDLVIVLGSATVCVAADELKTKYIYSVKVTVICCTDV
jgi:hypothetical protein